MTDVDGDAVRARILNRKAMEERIVAKSIMRSLTLAALAQFVFGFYLVASSILNVREVDRLRKELAS